MLATLLTILISALAGAGGTLGIQRLHVGWVSRRDVATEAYAAALQLQRAIATSLGCAHRGVARLTEPPSHANEHLFRAASMHCELQTKALVEALQRLQAAELKVRTVWSDDLADILKGLLTLGTGWEFSFAENSDGLVHGIPSDGVDWMGEGPPRNWTEVFDGQTDAAITFRSEVGHLVRLLRDFAVAAGAIKADPSASLEISSVVAAFRDGAHRQLPASAKQR